jgi:ribosome recycling factor
MKTIEASAKAKEMGEDEARRTKDNVQKQIDEANKNLDSLYSQKEQEINN